MKDRLVTPGYCFILAANFLLYFGFWLLIPVLPFYLSEIFNAGNSTIGIILSCYHTRRIIRHGDCRRKYGSHRHHALIKARRRARILRAFQQYSHGGGADVRLVSARCGHELYYHFLLLAGFLHCRIYLRLIGEDTIQTACQARADFARPFYPAERHSGGYQPASIIHSLRDDHQLRGHVCQRNRH